jgi:multiple RNA-binding domain-containing protein 1
MQVHVVKDSRTSKSKGLGFVQFIDPEDAAKALHELDGQSFQGRLLHLLPASDRKDQKLSDFEISKLPLKQQKALKRKSEAPTQTFSWNSLYMNPDAVLSSTAQRLGVSKSDLLDPSSADAAVKQAHAETAIIQETKEYLRNQKINIAAFSERVRDDRSLLIKNFPYGTTSEELSEMLTKFGSLEKLILPPSGTMAIALFLESHAAKAALKSLAYSNLKGSVLYLEKGPKGLFDVPRDESTAAEVRNAGPADEPSEWETKAQTSTIFIRNLNFATTTARLGEVFRPLSGFMSAKVKTRTDKARPGETLSMGFGFAEFRTRAQAEAAIATMNGHRLDGHELLVQLSNKLPDAAEERRKEDSLKKADSAKTKIIIKNLPFEASKKDLRALFGAYGQLRSIRMPRKFDNSVRGFAFADFASAKEATSAMEALSNTHLLGRKLVLDFAEGETNDPEETIKAMEKKAGRHEHLANVTKMLSGSARRKFAVEDSARDEDA